MVVGRDSTCEIVIDDARASRRHATFRSSPNAVAVEDSGSTNGIRINDLTVRGAQRLAHGDRVEVGAHVFILMDAEHARSSPTKSGGAATRRVAIASTQNGAVSLESAAAAIERGDIDAAGREMVALVPRLAIAEDDTEVARGVALLLKLAVRPGGHRFLDFFFMLHGTRGIVPSGEAIDVLKNAQPTLGVAGAAAIEAYFQSMASRIAALPAIERVRLRRLESLGRPQRRADA